jgi:uncharacterized protein YbjT (DUF2867 family)
MNEIHVVIGAFGYSGHRIAQRLIERGISVRTITNSPPHDSRDAEGIEVYPLSFDDEDRFVDSLRGARVLYNTYWVRFNHRQFTHETAVQNSAVLWRAARRAGIERIVHVSITNPSLDSPFEYFRGKARIEADLVASGVDHSILRPAVLFGDEDILINNIAWALRHLPVFGVFGDGHYRLQPIHVDDLANLAIAAGQRTGNEVVNAIGPETYSYRDLATTVAGILELRRPVISVPPRIGYAAGWVLGKLLNDVMITWEEVGGLSADLLAVDGVEPVGTTRLSEWASQHRDSLGRRYASELVRRRPGGSSMFVG